MGMWHNLLGAHQRLKKVQRFPVKKRSDNKVSNTEAEKHARVGQDPNNRFFDKSSRNLA
jgi:hypothetical protein